MTPNPLPKPTARSRQPRWSREQIRQARAATLAPLARAQGLRLIERDADNFEPASHPGLLIKENYWRWPEEGLSGNTIDFFTIVMKMPFHTAMVVIHGENDPPNGS